MQNPLSDRLYHSRVKPRKPDIRGDYFRDQTAIIHSTPFRRLKHKTQVFFLPQNDHICTRIEHVLHVSTIATTICKGLDLDVELAQAIALGHDLGHAPFGHIGEKTLSRLSKSTGGFIHEVHGLAVVDRIANNGRGLNLTYAVRDGIVSHCGEAFTKSIQPERKPKNLEAISGRQSAPLTYEGCVVRVADKIAYLGRDIEDAITVGLITPRDIPRDLKRSLGRTNGQIIDTLVMDVIRASFGKDRILFSDGRFDMLCRLKDFNYERIYKHPRLLESDRIIHRLLTEIHGHLTACMERLGQDEKAYAASKLRLVRHFGQFLSIRRGWKDTVHCTERCVVDFIAGMTDSYALEAAREILFPNPIELV
ncbi:HD domain-containing protein [bacterium]|nr:HD domain-containing protein [bacterium]